MKYNFYDDMGLLDNFMPNNYNGNFINNEMINNQFNYNGNNLDLYSPYDGYINGNAFKNLYVPYKNFKPLKVNINSEKEEMLFNLGQYAFMMHEMNLYLDVHPNDKEALNKFRNFQNKKMELKNIYERKYGPLMLTDENNNDFSWSTTEWPWVN